MPHYIQVSGVDHLWLLCSGGRGGGWRVCLALREGEDALESGSLGRPGQRLLKAQLRGRPGGSTLGPGSSKMPLEGNETLHAYRSQERAGEERGKR